MNEAECNTNAVRSFKHYGYGAHKLSDQGGKFSGAKPCDIIARSPKGRYIAVEGKIIKKWSSFSSKVLRPNQRHELEQASATDEGRGFVFLYVRITADKLKGIKAEHWCVVFDWKIFSSLLDGGITALALKDKTVGLWLPALKNEDGKTIYDIRKIMRR